MFGADHFKDWIASLGGLKTAIVPLALTGFTVMVFNRSFPRSPIGALEAFVILAFWLLITLGVRKLWHAGISMMSPKPDRFIDPPVSDPKERKEP